jgi:putative ABC transport system permease protein
MMTTITETVEHSARAAGRADDGRDAGGGSPARRAVVRWAWRLFRREWRQQILIVVLLTAAVAGAIGMAAAGYNLAPVQGNSEFGSADHFVELRDPDPATVPSKLAAAREWFGDIDAIGHTAVVAPGTNTAIDHRVQDPAGPFGGPLLALRSGRFPTDATEAAISAGVAQLARVAIGGTVALDGVERSVVGIVENPSDLDDDFVLLASSQLARSSSVKVLVDAGEDRVEQFRIPGERERIIGSRGDIPEDVVAVITVFVISMLAMCLVALVAAVSFVVIAQRRLPQLGMLSAVGATERHVRLTMIANGVASGAVAAVAGAVIGIGGWFAFASQMEGAVGHRIDPLNVPWWLLVAGMLLAVVTATAAAWWPARTMARIPTVLALSGRPPPPKPVHRSAALAVGLVVVGTVCLAIGADAPDSRGVPFSTLLLIGIGSIAVLAGVLLVGPIAIRVVARCASRLPVTSRLALRDLSRYQARSGAALAAISLVVGIPIAIVVTIAAADNSSGPGDLASNQLLVSASDLGPFVPDAADVGALEAGVDRIAAALGRGATVVGFDAAANPAANVDPDVGATPAIAIAERVDSGWRHLSLLFVASDEALGLLGMEMGDLDPDVEIHTAHTGEVGVLEAAPPRAIREEVPLLRTTGTLPQTYSDIPATFIREEDLRGRGWTSVPSGLWIVQATDPLTDEQLSSARDIAAVHGLTVDARDVDDGLAALRVGAVSVGMLIALAVLAMTVGLIRSETAGDLRTLTATGATSSTRRRLTAVTAGALAALGVVLGAAGAYIALAAGGITNLTPIPYRDLAIIAFGTPLAAAAAGWLLAGREPPVIARRPLQ